MQDNTDHIKLIGRVTDSVHEIYTVDTDTTTPIKARLSGKLRFNKIQILVGDFVELRISPYDLSHGQITRRLNEGEARRLMRK